MKVNDLKPNPDNPRTITQEHMKILKKSITGFSRMMELRPIVYDPDTMIVLGGNQRLAAIIALGMEEIPDTWVKPAPGLSPEEQREFIIKDNVPLGDWDWNMLQADWDTSLLEDYGLEIPEIGTRPGSKKAKEDDYRLPPLEQITTKIQPGDVITIGLHRILCGDTTEPQSIEILMNGRKADMVLTDPPYNVNYSGKGKNTSNKIANDHMDSGTFQDFLHKAFDTMKTGTKQTAPWYICHASSSQREFENAMNDVGLETKAQIIWVKPVASFGWGDYRWMHEPIFYATLEKKAAKFYGDRKQYTIWKEDYTDEQIAKAVRRAYEKATNGASTVWEFARDNGYVHPTQKPVLLCAKAIENSSKDEDIVLDGFLGSGSTMVAAHQLDRICYGIEMEPRYCQAIIDRMIELEPELVVTVNGNEYSA